MNSKSLKEKILGRWAGLRTAEEAIMVDDLSELLRINRETVRAHNKTHLDNYEDEGMGNIHVGDVVTNEAGNERGGMGKGLMATLLLGALAGGSGLGFFAPLLLGGGEAVPTHNPDRDTRYILGLGKPDKQETGDEIPKREEEDSGR